MELLAESSAPSQRRATFAVKQHSLAKWLPMIVLPIVILVFALRWPTPWVAMWGLAVGIYIGCKCLSWHSAAKPTATMRRKLAWWLAWPGMDAERFLSSGNPAVAADKQEWSAATFKTFFGTGLFFLAGWLVAEKQMTFAGAWLGMIAFILAVHCGAFHLLSCLWRSDGIDARPLMDRPLASKTVAEFWGRRWNRAFRDVGYRAIFRPLVVSFGPTVATIAVFGFSGVLHELVISVPAGGGFGLPSLYFALQASAVLLENSSTGKRVLGRGWRGRVFSAAAVAAPISLLFHSRFVEAVVVPFLKAIWPN